MWLDRDGYCHEPAAEALRCKPQIIASYRRGILRAKVRVHELSRHVACIDCLETPLAGAQVWLTFPGLEARGAIVEQCERFRARLRFSAPLHPAVLDALLGGRIRSFH